MVANSAQARAVFAAVHTLDHPTADQVFRHVRRHHARVSLATVYRNLDRLVADGDVMLRDLGGHKRYDPNLEPHVHLHDVETDRLVDVAMPAELQAALDAVCDTYLSQRTECIIEVKGKLKETIP